MSAPPLNLAMIGTGKIADTQLAPALGLAQDARLWSVLSRDSNRAGAFARRHGAAAPRSALSNLGELLRDDDLDGVILATPDGLHARQAVAAMRAGKHVLVEKPMATSWADARTMLRISEEQNVRLGVAYHLRWHAGHRAIRNLLDQGILGTLRHVRVQWTWPAQDDSNWRAHSDVGRWWSLAGVGTHCLDLIRFLMVPTCGEISRTTGITSRSVWRGPHDETAVAAFKLESGATAEFCSSVQFASPSRVEVYGADDYAIGTGTLGAAGAGEVVTGTGPLPFEVANPFQGEIQDFAQAIRVGRPPEVDGEEGLRNVEILEKLG